MQMKVNVRDFHWADDFELVRNFLIDTFNLTESLLNWIPSRFENRKYGPCGPEYQDEEDQLVKIWEDLDDSNPEAQAKIIAVTILNSSPESYINIHPDYRHLEREIIPVMEEQKKAMGKTDDGEVRIAFEVPVSNIELTKLLEERGYTNLGLYSQNRIRPLDLPIPDYQLPDGYSIRHADVVNDFEKYRTVIGSVFTHCGEHMTEKSVKLYSEASFYHEGLDLVVVAPDGNYAAFTTVRMDPISKIVEFEPVGTHPDKRKLGLAKSIILEGLKRLKKHNPLFICIPGAASNDGAIRLYDSLGFTKEDVHVWRKYL